MIANLAPPDDVPSCFEECREDDWLLFKTSKITPSMHGDLARTAAWIRTHLIAEQWDAWNFHVREGSLTFQKKDEPGMVYKVWCDIDNRLAIETGRNDLHADPVVIGLELGGLTPFERSLVRGWLLMTYGPIYYVDPRVPGQKKVKLQTPQRDNRHYYDVLFLRPGAFEMPVGTMEVQRFLGLIQAGAAESDETA